MLTWKMRKPAARPGSTQGWRGGTGAQASGSPLSTGLSPEGTGAGSPLPGLSPGTLGKFPRPPLPPPRSRSFYKCLLHTSHKLGAGVDIRCLGPAQVRTWAREWEGGLSHIRTNQEVRPERPFLELGAEETWGREKPSLLAHGGGGRGGLVCNGDLGRWLCFSGPSFPPLENGSTKLSQQFAGADPGSLGGLRVRFLGPLRSRSSRVRTWLRFSRPPWF